jgi:ribosomal protein L32E
MVEHIVALSRAPHQGRAAEIAAEVASEKRQAVLERCLADGTVAEVRCVLAADSLEAIQRCAP